VTDALGLALRVGLSFSLVLGLMWLAARVFKGSLSGRGSGALEVLARQQVGRGASVAVVRVADRALVVGVTEHSVTVLGDPVTDLEPFRGSATTTGSPRTPATTPVTDRSGSRAAVSLTAADDRSPLRGSILSPTTWRQALQVLRDKTVRRG
jgi:flagellar protein FliO/FliZ